MYLLLFFISIQFTAFAAKPFRFALFTDMHISILKPQNTEDLQFAVKDVNAVDKIDFVLISGDDSDLGDTTSLKIARKILSELKVPYYITSGNHDTKQGQIGSANFIRIFGSDKFSFVSNGYQFIGFPTGPEKGGSIGHVSAEDLHFVKTELEKTGKTRPTFIVTHYPLLPGDVDNRKDMTELLKEFNVKAILNGHYHRNVLLSYDGLLGIVNRSTQRAKEVMGGYSVYTVSDSLKVSEKRIGETENVWLTLPLQN